jgi:hypothetical protein
MIQETKSLVSLIEVTSTAITVQLHTILPVYTVRTQDPCCIFFLAVLRLSFRCGLCHLGQTEAASLQKHLLHFITSKLQL